MKLKKLLEGAISSQTMVRLYDFDYDDPEAKLLEGKCQSMLDCLSQNVLRSEALGTAAEDGCVCIAVQVEYEG